MNELFDYEEVFDVSINYVIVNIWFTSLLHVMWMAIVIGLNLRSNSFSCVGTNVTLTFQKILFLKYSFLSSFSFTNTLYRYLLKYQNLVEEKDKKVKELQDNVAAVAFTPQSKMGKMLMAKCRTLQEENEEIGNQANEGKVHLHYCILISQINGVESLSQSSCISVLGQTSRDD